MSGRRLREAGTNPDVDGAIVAAGDTAEDPGVAAAAPVSEFAPDESGLATTAPEEPLPGGAACVCADDCPSGCAVIEAALVPLGGVAATTAGAPNADCCIVLGAGSATPGDGACLAAAEIRLESESRRSRARSVRNSAACW